MSDTWRKIDLAGGGLQSANVRLARLLRKRGVARALFALFPLGLHRDYLHDRRGAWLYRAATLIGVVALLSGHSWIAGLVLTAGAAFAIYDFARLEDAVARVNKKLRMQVYLSQTAGAPAGFGGHYTDEPQPETLAQPPAGPDVAPETRAEERTASFAEQERRLRELAARRTGGK
jgi:hypothetical protein